MTGSNVIVVDTVKVPDWMTWMRRSCPFCGSDMEVSRSQETPNIGDAECRCGFGATFNVPYDMEDKRFPTGTLEL